MQYSLQIILPQGFVNWKLQLLNFLVDSVLNWRTVNLVHVETILLTDIRPYKIGGRGSNQIELC